jgi:hypothetical protein
MTVYLIKSAACLILLLLVYYAFLEREKMHTFNRYFLLGSLIFSLTIPLIIIEMGAPSISNLQLSNRIDEMTAELDTYSTVPAPVPLEKQPVIQEKPSQADIPFLLIGYLLVSSVLLIRLLNNLYTLGVKIRRNTRASFQKATLLLVDDCRIPHSFFSYIFVDKRLYQTGNIDEAIFAHELTHARQKHSLDILFLELLKVAFWFNPVIYFYKRAIQLNHEFLADETVIANSQNVSRYQRLLLKLQSGETDMPLASSIHYSITKKRIMMMTKKSSRLRTACKQLALIPLLAGLVFAFCTKSATGQDVQTMSITELLRAVEAKMESADSLTTNEKEELNSIITKIQEDLNFQVPPPPAPAKASDTEEEKIENIIASFQEHARFYSNIEAVPKNREKLEDSYKKTMILYDELVKMQNEVKEKPPPPPPKPLDPQGRIEYHAEKSSPTHQPPADVSKKNHLRILVNREGLILMDEEPIRLSRAKATVKKFIANNGADPKLSDSPKKALVSIKPAENTSAEILDEIVDEVKEAYLDLWEAKAQDEFDTEYKSLGKADQRKVKKMYPQNVLIKKPDEPKLQ